MMDFLDALFRGLSGLARALHPRNLLAIARKTPLYGPLAVRSVRRRLLRNLLVGLSLGSGIVVFLGLAASFGGAAEGTAGKTRDLSLPADIVALDALSPDSRPVEELKWVAQAGSYETFDRWRAASSLGTRWVVGLTPGGRLWDLLGLPIPEGPGEVFLPEGLAAGHLRVGDSVSLGATGAAGFAGRQYRVSGVFGTASSDALLGEAVVMPLDELLDLRQTLAVTTDPEPVVTTDPEPAVTTGPEPATRPTWAGPNSFAVWQRDAGDLEGLRRRVATLFPEATLWWAGLPASRAYQSVGGFLSPGNLVLALTFVLAGLGVFNVMLLSLLQRKVQLGVLKALGAENDEVFLLLLLEGSFMAVGGTLLGLGGGLTLVRLLDRASLVPLHLTVGNLVWALALAATSFLLAAWLPATLCRRASPIQLMAGRRLYVNPRSTCAQCGRCGGF